jgi:NADH-quinone oxidoreductase subunit A
MQTAVLPVYLFLACIVALAVGLLLIPRLLNPSRSERVKEMPYESGMDPIHDTHRPFTVRFYLVAIAFLVFDVEVLFLYPWAVASRPTRAGAGIDAAVAAGLVESRHQVFIGVAVFFVLMAVGFLYDWRKGFFQWR